MAVEESEPPGPARRRRGRPRADQSQTVEDPRREILTAAATVISRNGLSGASTRLIAEAAGLRHSSVFYYFPTKDSIVGELLAQMVDPTLEALKRIRRARKPPATTLFAYTYFDTWNMVSIEGNLGLIRALPELQRDKFPEHQEKVRRLHDGYWAIVKAGQQNATFSPVDARAAAAIVISVVESAASFAAAEADLSPRAFTDQVVDAALRTVVQDLADLPDIARSGHAVLERLHGR